ncbi:MAG: S9 family peptidase, partial [Candidatus Marinimicrobia bacterium]|nr:S9 family peptidase [Candidatus Neomarinimicrobiota bacterium]
MSVKNNTIYYTVQKSQFEDEWKKLRSEHPAVIYGREKQVMTEIWQLDLKSWRSELVTSLQSVVTSLSVAPDGKKFAFVSKPDTTLLKGEGWSAVEIFDFASRKLSLQTKPDWRMNHHSPYGWLENVCWSADSKLLAFTIDFDGYPAEILISDPANEKLYQLNRPFQVSLNAGTLNWQGASGRLCFMAADHGRRRVYSVSAAEKVPVNDAKILTPGDVVIDQYSFDRSGKMLVVSMNTPEAPQDLYSVTGKKAAYKQLTKINPQIDTWEIPQISTISWKGALNDQVEGILMLPPDYRSGRALPLIVSIHGGPTSAANFSFYYGYGGEALFTARGFAVFLPNYRGSTGYGDEFMIQLIGNENNLDVEDILTGVDALVEQGVADPGRMAVMGWSNGGYLTNCIITKT